MSKHFKKGHFSFMVCLYYTKEIPSRHMYGPNLSNFIKIKVAF